MFFVYYFTRGYLVTVLYIRVKLSLSRRDAEHFSANMGTQTIPSVFFAFIFCVVIFSWFEAFLGAVPACKSESALPDLEHPVLNVRLVLLPPPRLVYSPPPPRR